MSEPSQQYAYFSVMGDFDPADITKAVGLQPSSTWKKGELHPRVRFERKFSRWILESRLSRDHGLEDHILDVLAQLDQNTEAFQKVAREYAGAMQLVGYFHEGYPGLAFSRELVSGLARYSLSADFDFYCLWSDDREDT